MEITKRDEKIYEFIEKHGFATVKQITNVFFNDTITNCDGCGAALVFVDPIKHSMDNIQCPWPVIQLNENLNNFPLIFASTD